MAKYNFFHSVTGDDGNRNKMYHVQSSDSYGDVDVNSRIVNATVFDIADPEIKFPHIRAAFEARFQANANFRNFTCWQRRSIDQIETFYEMIGSPQDFDFQPRTVGDVEFEGNSDLRCWWARGRTAVQNNRVMVFPPPVIYHPHIGWLVAIPEGRYFQEFTGVDDERRAFYSAVGCVKQQTLMGIP